MYNLPDFSSSNVCKLLRRPILGQTCFDQLPMRDRNWIGRILLVEKILGVSVCWTIKPTNIRFISQMPLLWEMFSLKKFKSRWRTCVQVWPNIQFLFRLVDMWNGKSWNKFDVTRCIRIRRHYVSKASWRRTIVTMDNADVCEAANWEMANNRYEIWLFNKK